MTNPTPQQLRDLRAACGLTQEETARVLHKTCRTYQRYESGTTRMPYPLWQYLRSELGHADAGQTNKKGAQND